MDLTSISPPANSAEIQIGDKNLHICKYCQRKFAVKGFFEDHVRKHTRYRERPLRHSNFLVELTSISPPANSAEIRRGSMVRQIGDNLDSRHICLDCGKHYAKAQSLSAHRKFHLGKNLHTCKYCQKKFAVKELFEDHVRTHTGERPFSCPRCMKSFASKSYFSSHKKKCLETEISLS